MPQFTFRARKTSRFAITAMLLGVACLLLDEYVVCKADVNSLFTSRDPFVRANIIEAFFWMSIGIGFICGAVYAKARKHKRRSILALLAALTLVVFGTTDLVEAHTGAWWRPWPLLLWKGLCGFSLLILFVLYRGDKRRATDIHQ